MLATLSTLGKVSKHLSKDIFFYLKKRVINRVICIWLGNEAWIECFYK